MFLFFLKLGINATIASGFSTLADHSGYMQVFEKAGIYVIALLSSDIDTILRINGTLTQHFDYVLLDRYFKLVDQLAVHSNLLGFIVDLSDYFPNRLEMVPRFKAVIRDIKEYLSRRRHRTIPVGVYGYNHGKSTLIAEYMSCGGPQVAADIYGLIDSRMGDFWCTNSSAAYDRLVEQYRSYPLPIIVQYGCQANRSHTFQKVQYILTGAGAEVFSGGIVYDWF
jgi:glycosyl hydrolase family 72 (putative glucanosyltransferase)